MVCLAVRCKAERPNAAETWISGGVQRARLFQGAFILLAVAVTVNTSSRWHKESGVPCLTCPGMGGCIAEGTGWYLELFQDGWVFPSRFCVLTETVDSSNLCV